jgi:hypothetical protein
MEPPLRVADDDVADVETREHRHRHVARVCALRVGVAVLRAERDGDPVGLDQRLQRAERGERRADDDLLPLGVLLREVVGEPLQQLDALEVVPVHLPVAGDQWGALAQRFLLGHDGHRAVGQVGAPQG